MAARELIVTVVDLPSPPSANRLWRVPRSGSGKPYASPEYRKWIDQADALSIALAQFRGVRRIDGPFEVHVVIQETAGDLDNRLKAILDYCEDRALISNDRNARKITMEYGEAPHGCHVTLTELA
jgi:Holliday junction resolvase RusA-like endonuclease